LADHPYAILNSLNPLGILPGQVATVNLSQRASYNSSGALNTGSAPGLANPMFIADPNLSGILPNLGANTERVGNTVNFNMALVKDVRVFRESNHLQFQWEVFNVFNHRNFNQVPGNTVAASTNNTLFMNLGQTNVGGRTMQFLVRFLF
jgi:hypothetical protein